MADKQFEISFSQLAHNQMAEALPSLLNDVVGFQILDKNDEETRGVGAVLAMLGKTLCAVPVFFLNGDVKTAGIYIVSQDTFIPADDKWIAILREKGNRVFGDGITAANDHTRGVPPGSVSIDLAQLAGFGKLASARSLLSQDEARKMLTYRSPMEFNLDTEIPQLGKLASAVFAKEFCRNEAFANAMLSVYSIEAMQKLAADAKKLKVVEAPIEEKQEQIKLHTTMADAKGLSDKEKELMMRNGVYVKDNRTQHTTAFSTSPATLRWETPTKAGWYKFRFADGKDLDLYLVLDVLGDCGHTLPGYPSSQYRNMLLSPVEGKADATMGRNVILISEKGDNGGKLHMKPETVALRSANTRAPGNEFTDKAFIELYNNQKPKGSDRDSYGPMHDSDTKCARACIFDSKGSGVSGHITKNTVTGQYTLSAGCCPDKRLVVVDTATDLHVIGDIVVLPPDCRIAGLKAWGAAPSLSSFSDIDLMLSKQAGAHPLTIEHRDDYFMLRSIHGSFNTMDKIAALSRLLTVEGLQAGLAQQLLNKAAREHTTTVLLKYAYPYMIGDDVQRSYGPGTSDGGTPALSKDESGTGTLSVQRNLGAKQPEVSNEEAKRSFIDKATGAANKGEKQVADLYTLQALLDSIDQDEIANQLRDRTMQAMDAYGRALFYLYWHDEDYITKYGEQDYKRWVRTLEQAFKLSGDIVYQLKIKRAGVENNDSLV